MHFILKGFSEKHGGIDTMSKDWLYVGYNIFTGKASIVDQLEVLWKDFRNFVVKGKLNEIPSPRFWALDLQLICSEIHEAISLKSDIREVYSSFKNIKTYMLPSQTIFGHIRRVPHYMLSIIPSNSPHLKHHLKTSVVFNPTKPVLV